MSDVKKIIPSKLETGVQQFLYKYLGDKIPAWMTPNQMTMIGAAGSLFGIICGVCARSSNIFLIGVLIGLLIHLIADDLDGYIARSRNMTSKTGAYLDLILDILHITYLIIALSFSGYISIWLAIFTVPVYALIIVTCMNYILYFKEFLFPRLGPIETHLFFAAICICGLIFGRTAVVTIADVSFTAADLVLLVGGIMMYYEMFRMQIGLIKRLKEE